MLSLLLALLVPAQSAAAPEVEAPEPTGTPATTVTSLSFDKGLVVRGENMTLEAHFILYGTAQLVRGDLEREGFNIQLARPQLRGSLLSEQLTYFIQAELAGYPTTPRLLDAQVMYDFLPLLRLTVGQFITPFSRQFLIPPFKLLFTDFAPSTVFFRGNRDRGVMLSGIEHGFDWGIGFFDGSGINTVANDNARGAFYARVAYDFIGRSVYDEVPQLKHPAAFLSLGVSAAYNDVELYAPDANGTLVEVGHVARRSAGVDLFAGYDRFTLQAEGYLQVTRAAPGTPRLQRYGGYAQLGFMVLPETVEVGVRGDAITFGEDDGAQTKQLAGVVAWYLYGHHLKLQARYAYQDASGVNPVLPVGQTHAMQIGMQLWF